MTEQLGELTLSFGSEGEVTVNLDEYVPIDENNLVHEFANQASAYAYLAVLGAQAEANWLDAKRLVERVRAETDKEVRRDLANEKVTEGKIAAEIELRKGYQDAVENELSCRAQHLVLRAVVSSMEQRAQMLISLGAHLRQESNMTGMLVNDAKAKLDALKVNTKVPF